MSHHLYAEDPEPSDRLPAGPLFVPVRSGPAGCTARLFRTPLGGRIAVAFTSPQRLAAALGNGQPWVRLAEPALRALTEPVGATGLTVDPRFAPDDPRAQALAPALTPPRTPAGIPPRAQNRAQARTQPRTQPLRTV